MKEIRKQQWSRLCTDLSRKYQFARTKVLRIDADGNSATEHQAAPLSRLSLVKRRGRISAFEVSLCEIRNGSPATSTMAIGAPTRILCETVDDNGTESIEVHNEDGHKLIIRLFGQTIGVTYEALDEEMAYSLAELRGFVPGHEREDWYRAERLVRKVAAPQA